MAYKSIHYSRTFVTLRVNTLEMYTNNNYSMINVLLRGPETLKDNKYTNIQQLNDQEFVGFNHLQRDGLMSRSQPFDKRMTLFAVGINVIRDKIYYSYLLSKLRNEQLRPFSSFFISFAENIYLSLITFLLAMLRLQTHHNQIFCPKASIQLDVSINIFNGKVQATVDIDKLYQL